MPIYEYECAKCGHEFEREQRMADPPVKTCPKCKGRKVTKLISRSSFVLKGGGWYADGYSSADSGKKSGGGDSPESSSSGSSESSSEKGKSSSSEKPKSGDKPKSKGGGKKGSSKSAA